MSYSNSPSHFQAPPTLPAWHRLIVRVGLVFGISLGSLAVFSMALAFPATVQVYYLPMPENHLSTAFVAIEPTSTGSIVNYISIAATLNNTLLYYDQWENGYDLQIANPINIYSASNLGGTQIWGDGNAANGCPPNINGVAIACTNANDIINSGNAVILNSTVNPANLTAIDFDAGDKIGASKAVAVTRTAWPISAGTLQAGSTELLDTFNWGVSYIAPVGINTPNNNNVTEYTGLFVMASQINTSVTVDSDGGGATLPVTVTLNEGQTYFVGNISEGATVNASAPVQVHQIIGDINNTYMTDFFALYPQASWASGYYSPVGTATNRQTRMFLYNPGPGALQVRCDFVSSAITVTLATANSSGFADVPDLSGAYCYSVNAGGARINSPFFSMVKVDGDAGVTSYDWSFTAVPEGLLTEQALIGWGPGQDPTLPVTENGGPLWVTPACPAASPTTFVYVDWNNDGTPDRVDFNGDGDTADNNVNGDPDLDEPVSNLGIVASRLESIRMYDVDDNQTGAVVYTRNAANNTGGVGCDLVVAWGEDPRTASVNAPGLDVGTTVPPLPLYVAGKGNILVTDLDGDGVASPNDELEYTIVVQNTGRVPVSGLVVSDIVPANTSYLLNSSRIVTVTAAGAVITNTLPDNGSGTPFPLDNGGVNIGSLGVREERRLVFRILVDNNPSLCNLTINNTASVAGVTSTQLTSFVTSLCEPKLEKSSTPANVAPGGTITYTLAYSVTGAFPVPNITISDTLPAGVTYVAGSATPFTPTVSGQNLIWNLGTITPTVNGTITFQGLVSTTVVSGTQLANIATISDVYSRTDPGVVTNTVINLADLLVTKTDGTTTYTPGQVLTYTIVARNAGPNAASNAVISDTRPASLSSWAWSCAAASGGASGCNPGTTSPFTDAITLPVGSAITYTVVATPSLSATGNLTNSVTISPPVGVTDPTPSNNSATDIDTIAQPDLQIGKTDGQTTVTPGQLLTYTLTITNAGNQTATGVRITDTIPANTAFIGASNSGVNSSGTVTWPTFTLAGGNTVVTRTVTVQVNNPLGAGITTITNTAIVADDGTRGPDPTPANNSTSDVDTVNAAPDLQIAKTDGQTTVTPGQLLTYTLTITNAGDQTATGVQITDTIPANTAFIGASNSGANSSGTVTWPTFTLAGGNTVVTRTVTVQVDNPLAAGVTSITNTAIVADDGTNGADPTPANNSASDVDTVNAAPDLQIVKTDNNLSVITGDLITYTLTYTNTGNQSATSVVITETVPANTTFVTAGSTAGWSCADGAASGTACVLSVGSVTVSPTLTATFIVRVNTVLVPSNTSNITNTVSIADDGANGADPTPANNSATELTPVTANADLNITKTDGVATYVPGEAVTYTIAVRNAGPGDANGAVISDTRPAEVASWAWTCTAASGGATGCDAGTGTPFSDTVNLPVGGAITYTVVATTSASATTNLVNTATITVPVGVTDPTPGNNTATDTDTPTPQADVSITKSDSPDPVIAGQTLTYTLTINNAGPSTASNVTVTDTLPAGVTFASATPAQSSGPNPLVWNVGTLAVGASQTFTVVVTVDAGTTGTITNTATIGSPTPDPTPSNNTDSEPTTVTAQADLSIAKTDNPDPVVAGQTLTYTLTISNAGPSVATGVLVTDTLPAGVTFVSASPTETSGPNPLVWNVGTLAVGASRTFTVVVTVDSTTIGTITNTATVGSPTTDPTPSNNTDNEPTTATAIADLSIVKTDNPDPVVAGQTLTYTLVVNNAGPSTATGVVVTDTLPAGVTFSSATPAQSSGPNPLVWNVGTLAVGASRTFTVVVTVDASTTGTITNTATVGSPTPDPTPGNNTDNEPTTVTASADLSIVKSDSPDPVVAGQTLTYTLNIANAGPSVATSVIVTDTLPAGVTFVSASPTETSGPNPLVWNVGTLAVGASRTFTVVVTVDTTTTGTITNTATVGSPTPDPTPSNNTDSEPTTVTASADLSIAKSDSPDPVIAGQTLTYTLTINNAGPSTATGVVVTDTLPAGVTFSSATPAQSSGPNPLVWNMGTLAVGASQTFTVVVTVDAGTTGTITNTATVGSPTSDPTPSNNTDNEPTTVTASADLSIVKSDSPDPVVAGQTLTYTLVVNNVGPSTATGVVMTDTLPAGVTFSSATPAQSSGPNPLVWNVGTLVVGASQTFTVVVTVDAGTVGTITNTATIGSPTPDPTPGNNTDSEPTTVTAQANLSITKTDNPDPVIAGQTLTYTLAINNAGPSVATSVIVTDTLPAGVTFSSATPAQSSGPNPLVWNVGTLAVGASQTFTVVVTVDTTTTGTITNIATVGSPTPDPTPSDNADSEPTTVTAQADLSITKTDNPDPVIAGQTLTYTLSVLNSGPSVATNVVVTDTLPAGVTFASATPAQSSGPNPLVWNVGTLAVGASQTFTVVVTVDTTTTGTITNTATVGSPTTDPTPSNNTDNEPTTVTASADLSIVKTDNPDPVVAGQTLTYTLSVLNSGPSVATNVVVTDTLPTGVTFSSATPAQSSGPNPVVWNVGTLAVGASRTFTVVVTVDTGTTGTITNTATVSSPTPDPTPSNNTDSEPTTVTAQADLSITKTDNPDPVIAGQTMTYTLVVNNAGPSVATSVIVTDTLPAGVTFASATPAQSSGPNPLVWNMGTLAVGASQTFTVVVTVDSTTTGTITNTATVGSPTPDPTPSNNSDSEPTTVTASADLSITKSDSPDPVIAGQTLTYTLSVLNSGPSVATNVVVTDTLPAGVTFVSASPTETSGPNPLVWNVGTLAVGASRTFTVVVTVDSTTTGTITNTATVGSPTTDPTPGNNTDSEPTTVTASADLSIVKTDNPDPVIAGQTLTYTLSVLNSGPSVATNVVVTDTLPAGVTFVSASPTETSGPNPLVWNVGTLVVGASQTFTVVVTVDSTTTGTITNTATVGSPTSDPTPSNNTDSEPTTVTAQANLSITKTDNPDPVIAGQTLTYTLSVLNSGPSVATNVVVTDTLPASVTFSSATPAQSSGPNPLVWNVGTLAVGASQTFTVVVTVDAGTTGTITNTATVGSPTPDPTPSNNTDSEPTTVTAQADLSITKTDNPDPVVAGQTLTYTLNIANAGPSVATSVLVTDTLPAGATFASATPAQSSGPNPLVWNVGTLAVGASRTFTVVVTVDSTTTGTITNTATVGSPTPDPTPSNNTDSEPTTVTASADLSIVKSDSPDPVVAGQTLTYTINISNAGPSVATGVLVTDTLPASVTFSSATPAQSSGPNPLGWNVGTLAVGASQTFTVVVTVDSTTTGTITNTAVLGSPTPDPTPSNNTDSEPTTVTASADLSITKSDSPDPVIAGQTLTYTLSIANAGPSVATSVIVTDTLPAGVTFASATPAQSSGPNPLGWNVGTLAVGASQTFTVVVTVDTTTTGTITNTATVGSPTPDPTPSNNTDSEPTTVTAQADLSITKTDNPDPVVAGQTLTYTLVVNNAGPSTASNVTVTDTLPAGVTFVSASPTETSGPNPLVWNVGTLAVGASRTFTVVVTVDSTTTGTITNTATVGSPTPDPTPGNNTDNEPTTVTAQADLSITKTDTPDPVIAGQTLTYTLLVNNAGPSSATNVVVTDTLPAGVTFASATPAQSSGPNPLVWNVGTLAVGASRTFTVVVTVDSTTTGTITNTATVGSPTPDPTPGNNADGEPTTVTASADLSIVKTDSPDPVVAGQTLTYTLVVNNAGPSVATGVLVTDTLPAGVTFASATPVQSSGPNPLVWNVGTLAVGANQTFTVVVTVDAGTTGTITNTAAVGSPTPDPTPGNNTDSEPTTVTASADLSITKSDSPDPVIAGQTLTYTLVVNNAGPSMASNVTVTDTLPTGVTFASASPTETSGPNPLVWNVGTLAVGASQTFTVVVTVDAGTTGTITNTAAVGSPTPDPTPSDNTDSEPTTVTASADLSIVKTDNPDPVVAGQTLTYTLVVNNAGPSSATNVVVTDTLPTGVTFASATPAQSSGPNPLVWNVGMLAVGASRTFTMVVTVDSTTTGTITNTATVGSLTPDPTPGNNTDSEPTTVTASADLSIAKSDSPDPVIAGQTLTYTLSVLNSGPSVATNVVVTDTLPAGVTFASATPAQSSGPNPLVWNVGTLAVGASRTFTVVVTVDSTTTGTITNTATVGSPTPDPTPSNNSDSEPTTVTASADLSIVKTDNPDPVVAGQTLTYTLVVNNAGPSTATGVVVTDTLPAGVTFSSATPAQSSGPNPLVWNVGTLAVGASQTFTVVVTVDAGTTGTITNTATVGSPTSDPTPSNNSDSEPTTVTANADLSIAKSDSPDPVVAGQTLTYTLVVNNVGPSTATGVVMADTLPAGVTFSSATPAQSSGPNPLVWNVGTLAVGASRTFTVVVTVDSTTTGTITNTATVGSQTFDPTPSNNSDSEPTTVTASADLSITKSDSPDPVVAGQMLTYTLVVNNAGPSTAMGVLVTDTLPAGATFASAAPAQSSGPNPLVWNVGTLAVGASRTFTVVVTVDAGTVGTITNTATVGSPTPDPTPSDNTDSEPTTVIASADLSIVKTDNPDPVVAGQTLTYTLVVNNAGPSSATNVVVTDTLPAGVTFSSATPAQSSGPNPLVWNVGTLAVGASQTFTVVVTVDTTTTGTITNTATVGSPTTDPTPGNNTDSEPTTVTASADLSIVKTDSPDPVVAGQMLTYTLVVNNAGPSSATNVVVTDTLPTGVTFASATPAQSSGPNPLVWNVGTLAVGASRTFTVVVTADTTTIGTITNTATVGSPTPDPTPSNNTDNEPTTVNGLVDLVINKEDGGASATPGGLITYTLTYTNVGPSNASGVVITDIVPANTTFSGTGWTCVPNANAGSVCTFNVGNLAGGASGSVSFVVMVDASLPAGVTQISNTATIGDDGAFGADPTPSNNSDPEITPVIAQPDLTITKTDNNLTAAPGDLITYTLTYTNVGNQAATGVIVTEAVPANTIFSAAVSLPTVWSCADNAPAGTPCTVNLGNLNVNAGGTLTFGVRVITSLPAGVTTITNTASIADDGTNGVDPTPTDNSDAEPTPVTAQPDLVINKDDGGTNSVPGGAIVYTLTFTNTGNQNASGVIITDVVPANTVFNAGASTAGWSCTPNNNAGSVCTFSVGTVVAGTGGSVTFAITVNAPLSGVTQINNTASIGDDGTNGADPTPSNNTDSDSTPLADFILEKSVSLGTATVGQPFTYTLVMTNAGNVILNPVLLTDTLPAGFTYVNGSGVPSNPNLISGQTLVWNALGSLAPGNALTVTFMVTASPATLGTFINVADASGLTPTGPVTDTDSIPVVLTDPSVVVDKRLVAADTDLTAPNLVTFTIQITNTGPSVIDVLPLIDIYTPTNLSFVSASIAPDDTIDDGNISWSDLTRPAPNGFGQNLAPGQGFFITTVFRVVQDITSTTNSAIVQGAVDVFNNNASDVSDAVVISNIPTAVKLLYFRVGEVSGQAVTLEWATGSEVDNFGFWLYRAQTDNLAQAEQVIFVPAASSGAGGSVYNYVDEVPSDGNWYYWLVDVDTNGVETPHGPVTTAIVPTAPLPYQLYLPLIHR